MNDNYNFFCDRVCSYVKHATEKEKKEIHKELADHIADHAQALMDIGRTEEEANAAAIVAMGDPEVIGKELNKEYPLLWLAVSRIALLVSLVLVLCLIGSVKEYAGRAYANIMARTAPISQGNYEYEHPIDIRVGLPGTDDIVYFYACDLSYNEKDDQYYAVIGLISYDKNIFGEVTNYSNDFTFYVNGERMTCSGGGYKTYGVACYRNELEVDYGLESVTAIYDRLGHTITVEIPLDWEGIA